MASNPILNILRQTALLVGPRESKSVGAGALVPSQAWRRPNWTSWTTKKGVDEGFNKSEWVKICVDRIATPASSVPWRVSRFTSRDAKKEFLWELKSIPLDERSQYIHSVHSTNKEDFLEPEPDHPLEVLVENPNPFLDRQTMIERMTQHILLGGNSIVTKVRAPNRVSGGSTGPPLELWVMPPDIFTPVPDRTKFIKHYEMEIPDQREPKKIPNEDLIHFMLPDPSNLYWGASLLRAAAMTIDMDIEAVKWQKQSLENRAAPDGVFAIQDDIDETEFEMMRDQMRIQYYGRENARTPMLIGNNAKYYQLSLSPVEMDFINSRKMNREAICALFGVDPRIAGAQSGGGSELKEVRRVHWTDLVIPFLDRLQSSLNRSLAPEFGGDILLWYDTMNVDALQENFHEKTKSLTLLARNGIPVQAINRRLRLGFYRSELQYLDKGFLPASSRSVENVIKEQENAMAAAATAGQGDQNGGPDGGEPDNPDENNPADAPNSDTSQTDEETQKRRDAARGFLAQIREEIKREDRIRDNDSREPQADGRGHTGDVG